MGERAQNERAAENRTAVNVFSRLVFISFLVKKGCCSVDWKGGGFSERSSTHYQQFRCTRVLFQMGNGAVHDHRR